MRMCIGICVYCLHVSEFMSVCVQESSSMCIYLCTCVCGGVSLHLWVHLYRVYLWICFLWLELGKGMQVQSCQLQNWPQPLSPRLPQPSWKAFSSFPSASGMLQWKPRFFLSENWRLRLPGAGDSEWLLMGKEFLCEVIRCSNIIQ